MSQGGPSVDHGRVRGQGGRGWVQVSQLVKRVWTVLRLTFFLFSPCFGPNSTADDRNPAPTGAWHGMAAGLQPLALGAASNPCSSLVPHERLSSAARCRLAPAGRAGQRRLRLLPAGGCRPPNAAASLHCPSPTWGPGAPAPLPLLVWKQRPTAAGLLTLLTAGPAPVQDSGRCGRRLWHGRCGRRPVASPQGHEEQPKRASLCWRHRCEFPSRWQRLEGPGVHAPLCCSACVPWEAKRSTGVAGRGEPAASN